MITYRSITTTDPEYESEKALRNRVLRLPIGRTLSDADISGEDEQTHLIALDGSGTVVACVLLVIPGDGTAHIRQMAVEERFRKRGVGAGLIAYAEQTARGMGIRKINMHARVYARGFYERLGYRAAGEEFIEVTIPHIEMEKTLEGEDDEETME
ncbi:MAG: GNAT family N-acetyltransferase [Anaerolineales bacterium]|nr:GNAT family N-acetyltransferase [Anaerolineales bacterium]